MKKNVIRILCALLCVAMLAACGAPAASNNSSSGASADNGAAAPAEQAVNLKKTSIGVALYSDTGPAPTATKAYLESLKDALNCEFKYTLLTQTDEAANLTKIQELIASGVDGIICTMDMGMPAIIDECEAAGVYIGGYLADYDTSFTQNYDKVFKSPNFVGTVADGDCSDNLTVGHVFFDSLMEYNERNPEAPISHISMCVFPPFAFPQHQVYAEQLVADIEEYNKTAEKPITVDPLDPETDVLMFSPADTTYFTKHPGIDAVCSLCGSMFVYGSMVQTGVDKTVKLFGAGYTEGDNENFGSRGAGTFQQEVVSAVEAVTFPVVLLINKINGLSFPDQPEVAERQPTSRLIINSDEDMAIFETSVYLTADAKDALLTPEEVLNMTAANPDATYAGLVDFLSHMTIEDVAANK